MTRIPAIVAMFILVATAAHAEPPVAAIWGTSPIAEPYPYVSTGNFSGPAVPASPDPLVRYRWPHPKASDGLEIYLLRPESVSAEPAVSFANVTEASYRVRFRVPR